jgi:hypothetical protein
MGPEGNILETAGADDIGVLIVKNKAQVVDYKKEGEKNTLRVRVKR